MAPWAAWLQSVVRVLGVAWPALLCTAFIGLLGAGVIDDGAAASVRNLLPLTLGSAVTVGVACVVGIPMGLLSAVYISELASPRARRVLKPLQTFSMCTPAVVWAYAAVMVMTPALQQWMSGLQDDNALSPGIVLGIMMVPTMSMLSENALNAVSNDVREAACALGAAPLAVVRRVVIPNAQRGLLAASLIALSRVLAEGVVVAVACGHPAVMTADVRMSMESLSSHLLGLNAQDALLSQPPIASLAIAGMALLAVTALFNGLGQWWVRQ